MTAIPPTATASDDCLARNEWICGEYLSTRREVLWDAVLQHLQLTLVTVVLAVVLAVPLAVAARRWRWASGPVLGVTTALYTIPSLAMFSLLLPLYGLTASLVTAGLVLYEPALESGQIDVVREYAATFADWLNAKDNGPDAPAVGSPDLTTTMAALRSLTGPRGLTVLDPG